MQPYCWICILHELPHIGHMVCRTVNRAFSHRLEKAETGSSESPCTKFVLYPPTISKGHDHGKGKMSPRLRGHKSGLQSKSVNIFL